MPPWSTLDGNHAVASVAYRLSEVIAIYPITPSSTMGELADEWSSERRPNLWGAVPVVAEMQSEGGAAGAVHGALQAGSLATTFTASQGLLLMIPDMYKIAGELTSFCMHVTARTVATHALSIFGDHSDVMACRQTGFAMLASASVQEAQDMAAVAHAATLSSRVPFLHFFDGFRTSHEVAKISPLEDEVLSSLIDPAAIAAHRARALAPEHPVLRGSAQNPDTYFQAREAVNRTYEACPAIVQATMDRLAARTGRRYGLFEYTGHPEAERVVVVMGSAAQTAAETVRVLVAGGARVGVVAVRLFRPFSLAHFAAALPPSVRRIAVLDRTKEPGAVGEPLYQDVVSALAEIDRPERCIVTGGRYGLSSKELTPAMLKSVLDALDAPAPRRHFTVGIVDDVTGTSLPVDPGFDIEAPDVVRAIVWGRGSDGSVGASKSSVQIVGEHTDLHVQGYFVYDSKKSGAVTVSHLRFGPRPIRAPYLVRSASLVACHDWGLLDRYDVLADAAPGATLLLNAPMGPERVWGALPNEVQHEILRLGCRVWSIDAGRVAREAELGGRINTVMQVCFFALAGFLPREAAIQAMKESIERTYGRKGTEVVARNFAAVDAALHHLAPVAVGEPGSIRHRVDFAMPSAPDFVQRVTAVMLAGHGDHLPVSAFPIDGTWPVGTARWEKRNLADEIPVWSTSLCIQCNKCTLVCPHAAIRAKVYEEPLLRSAPEGFPSMEYRGKELAGQRYTLQTAPEDCTGCGLCVAVCPAHDRDAPGHKALEMSPQPPLLPIERGRWEFFLGLPEVDRRRVHLDVKGTQLLEPLFESSGACAGCGETPYLKLVTQLFGDRALIANATGCSSIFGGNLPTTPYCANDEGRGPAWANSLFEDNAEFGYGMRLAADAQAEQARMLLAALAPAVGDELVRALSEPVPAGEQAIEAQRERVLVLRRALAALDSPEARRLEALADSLVPRSIWIVGGDGWAYDIGFGGLDHVVASGRKVNVLVLDTEVYSNTGGQQSKATPLGASARFAVKGKTTTKKDLGLMAMSYGNVYVARIALGAKDAQTVQAFLEADSYPGPALLIAYSHCIAHGYDLSHALDHQRSAVASGYWPLYRFDPRRLAKGESALRVDSPPSRSSLVEFMRSENRFRSVEEQDPARFGELVRRAEADVQQRLELYRSMARRVQ